MLSGSLVVRKALNFWCIWRADAMRTQWAHMFRDKGKYIRKIEILSNMNPQTMQYINKDAQRKHNYLFKTVFHQFLDWLVFAARLNNQTRMSVSCDWASVAEAHMVPTRWRFSAWHHTDQQQSASDRQGIWDRKAYLTGISQIFMESMRYR